MSDAARTRPRASTGPGESASTTLRQLVRGIAGGLLLGLPPLFTMEMWFQGFLMDERKIIVLILFTFVIVIGYSAFSGFRRERSWPDLVLDSVATMGVAAVVSAVALWLIGRIDPGIGLGDAVGKIGLQMIPISLGVSLAGAQLADPEDKGEEAADLGTSMTRSMHVGPWGRLSVVAGAALFLSLNIAPTEETIFLAVGATWWGLVLIVIASLLMSYAIVFYADFRGGRKPGTPGDSPLDHPLTETVVSYALSLLVSGLLIWSFGRTEGTPYYPILAQIVLLGVVAAFGGAAGRLLIGGGASGEAA
ncbi:MAG TPA: TIGR02587 family membrane protein [Woeseiaceae bacterium]|nr:TIGR02587 family membrane protein [Woeseiaceae bacterium]